jgi:dihydroorotase
MGARTIRLATFSRKAELYSPNVLTLHMSPVVIRAVAVPSRFCHLDMILVTTRLRSNLVEAFIQTHDLVRFLGDDFAPHFTTEQEQLYCHHAIVLRHNLIRLCAVVT